MTNEELCAALVDDLRPVRRLPSAEMRAWRWAALAVLCVAAGAAALGVRPDLGAKLAEPFYVAENGALLVAGVLAARRAFQLTVPGRAGRRRARLVPLVPLAACALLLVLRAVLDGASAGSGVHCVAALAVLSAVPAAVGAAMLRRGAPLAPPWTRALALLAAGALAAVGIQVSCSADDPGHVAVWHLAPLLVAAALGFAAGRRR